MNEKILKVGNLIRYTILYCVCENLCDSILLWCLFRYGNGSGSATLRGRDLNKVADVSFELLESRYVLGHQFLRHAEQVDVGVVHHQHRVNGGGRMDQAETEPV